MKGRIEVPSVAPRSGSGISGTSPDMVCLFKAMGLDCCC